MISSVASAPSIFDSFNARSLEPREVARSFVPPIAFRRLAKNAHSILVGPRGSGKTTLLKMLEVASINAWTADTADTYRKRLNFTGVLIQVDRTWSEQLGSLRSLVADSEIEVAIQRGTIRLHTQRALVEAFLQRFTRDSREAETQFRRVLCSPSDEARLAEGLAHFWRVRPTVLSLRAVQTAISDELARIGDLVNRLRLTRGSNSTKLALEEHALFPDLIGGVVLGLDQFQQVFPQNANERWALLFDELELAPPWLIAYLRTATRSVDRRLLFKLALSPYDRVVPTAVETATPDAGHDYEEIPLWYADKGAGIKFCRALWQVVFRSKANLDVDLSPAQILGRSRFEAPGESRLRGAYRPESDHAIEFAELQRKDRSFAAYMAKHRLSPASMSKLPENERAALVRKIGPAVMLRNFFLKEFLTVDHAKRRSRKTYPLFGGYESIFAMTEGNPRWFKGLVGDLVELSQGNGATFAAISAEHQVEAVDRACNQFRALIRGLPVNQQLPGDRGLLGILDQIGDYFFDQLVLQPFRPDAPLTFTVDRTAPTAVVEALGVALNAGALVLAPQQKSKDVANRRWTLDSLRSVKGNRFRLCYLLAAQYGLLLRLGEAVSLGTILNNRPPRRSRGGQLDFA
jgi:hypothetical protein